MGVMDKLADFLGIHEKEKKVLDELVNLAEIIELSFNTLKDMILNNKKEMLSAITNYERKGDSIRRNIELHLFEGAFLPQSRHLFFTLAERMDSVIDRTEDCGKIFDIMDYVIDDHVMERVREMLDLTTKTCNSFTTALNSFIRSDHTLMMAKTKEIREMEEQIDRIKHEIFKILIKANRNNFWEERTIVDLVDKLEDISDNLEDATDVLHIAAASLKM